jgi:hypothetical protein
MDKIKRKIIFTTIGLAVTLKEMMTLGWEMELRIQ